MCWFDELSHAGFDLVDEARKIDLKWERVEITTRFPPDESAQSLSEEFGKLVAGKKLNKVLGRIKTPLDGRFQVIRTEETNLSNWVADVVRETMKSDVCLINSGYSSFSPLFDSSYEVVGNLIVFLFFVFFSSSFCSGTLRIDNIIPEGDFTMRSFVLMLPMTDEMVVIGLTGELLLQALENGVSAYPRTEGRFPILSGVRFTFRSTEAPGARVVRDSVTVNGAPLDLAKEYSVATKAYLAQGKDGYNCFVKGRVIVGETEASVLPNIVRNRFLMMHVMETFLVHESATHKAQHKFCNVLKLRRQRSLKAPAPPKPAQDGDEKEGEGEGHSGGKGFKRSRGDNDSGDITAGVRHKPSPLRGRRSSLDLDRPKFHDLHFLESSDSETEGSEGSERIEVQAFVDGRITRLD